MKIYAIRHGLTEFNKKRLMNGHLDDGLAPEGFDQAREAAPFIPKSIKRIYSSPLLRARQTAETLNAKLDLKITFHDELKEVNYGLLNGTNYTDELRKKNRSTEYDWRPHQGESFADVKKRVLKILREIKASEKDGEVLIVTHGGIIRLISFLEQGKPIEEIQNMSLHSFDLDKILLPENPKPLELIDIVISIYNQERLIERVLGGVFRCTTTPFNLVLVFDGCTDRTKEVALNFIKKEKPTLLRDLKATDAPNVFETKANNIGFKLATSDYILTVQDDVVIEEKGWERRMTWPIRRWDDVFAVTGRAALDIIVAADGTPRFVNSAAREFLTLPRNKFIIRTAINRGPVALRADILRKLNFLEEAFAPAQLDEADLVMRAYEQFKMKSGAIAIDWRSDLAWGKTRGKDSTMNTSKTLLKNSALLKSRHPDFTSQIGKLDETRSVKDSEIDYRDRDSFMQRKIRQIEGFFKNLSWLVSRKWHAVKVRLMKK